MVKERKRRKKEENQTICPTKPKIYIICCFQRSLPSLALDDTGSFTPQISKDSLLLIEHAPCPWRWGTQRPKQAEANA